VPTAFRSLSSRRLTVEALRTAQAARSASSDSNASAMATSTTVTTYTPAQIRAAYGLPTLPTSYTGLTAAQAAQLGAGQTIYIVDAMHNPNVAAELAAFNSKFGLPTCTTKAIATTATLPLAAPSSSACELSVVYSNTRGAIGISERLIGRPLTRT
jgi:subtilase family serine protease